MQETYDFFRSVAVTQNPILGAWRNQIECDSRHFEGKSIFTTFLYFSPYVRIQKLGWVIYDCFPCPPPPLSKISLGNF